MAQYYTLPTAIGEAKIANAIALGTTITISEIAIGDGGGVTPVPDSDVPALVNEVRRAPINTSVVDPDNPSWIVVEQVLPPDIGGWTIREIGLYDADGDLIAYGNYPETYKPVLSEGSGRTQTIRFVMQVSDTAAVTLKVDPSVVLATREYVDDEIAEHEQSRNHPDATTVDRGFVRKATSAEAKARSSTVPVVTPAGLGAALTDHEQAETAHNSGQIALAAPLANFVGAENVQAVLAALGAAAKLGKADNAQAQDFQKDTHALTPASLIAGVLGAGSAAGNGYAEFPYRDATTGELRWLILQWGSSNIATTDPVAVPFPIGFPNKALHVAATDKSVSDTSEAINWRYDLTTLSTAYFNATSGGNTGQFGFFAVGH